MRERLRALAGVVAAVSVVMTGTATALPGPVAGEAAARTAVVIDPAVHEELVLQGVEVTGVGGATASSYEGTVKVKLPVDVVTETGVKHSGGIRFAAGERELVLKKLTIPESGFVTAKVTGTEVGKIGRASVFLQAEADSPLGDTSLRITFTAASYLNQTFGTTLSELDLFAYSTTHL